MQIFDLVRYPENKQDCHYTEKHSIKFLDLPKCAKFTPCTAGSGNNILFV